MKKIFLVLLTVVLSTISISCVYAAEPRATVMTSNWRGIMDILDESEHGGIYIEDDILHIKPIANTESIEVLIDTVENKTRREENKQVVIDDVAQYTVQELMEAQDRIWDNDE